MQLRTYGRFFEETENRDFVRKELGFTAYRPRLTLVVGKTISHADDRTRAEVIAALDGIELRTYQDLLNRYKRLHRFT